MASPAWTAPSRPQGQPTRGKTAPNRLRRVDTFVLRYAPHLLSRRDGDFATAPAVDLGFGEGPATTIEMAQRFRRIAPGLPVVGVEIDRDRVAAALPFADDGTRFIHGGFNVPLGLGGDGRPAKARLVRAFNVLRQYGEDEVAGAWALMGAALAPGGLLVEGTSDPFGRLWAANLLRKDGDALRYEALVLSVSFRTPFEPASLQPVLPKNLIHRVTPGEPIAAFFEAWGAAARATVHERVWGARPWFAASAEALAAGGYSVAARRAWLRDGFLVWRDPPLGEGRKGA
jgi:hypothetical protein